MDAGVPVFIIFAFLVGMFVWYKKGNDIKKKIDKIRESVK